MLFRSLAVDTLIKMIQGEEIPDWDVKLPVELIVRDSVKTIGSYVGYGKGHDAESK